MPYVSEYLHLWLQIIHKSRQCTPIGHLLCTRRGRPTSGRRGPVHHPFVSGSVEQSRPIKTAKIVPHHLVVLSPYVLANLQRVRDWTKLDGPPINSLLRDILFRTRRKYRSLTEATANDQRALLEAAVFTLLIERNRLGESSAFRRLSGRVSWKVEVDHEIQRIQQELKGIFGYRQSNIDRVFAYIDRIAERLSSKKIGPLILEICRDLRVQQSILGRTLESAFLTRMEQKLGIA